MDCLIINLETSDRRMAFMAQQMDALGLGYERIAAVTAEQASRSGSPDYWNTWERPLKETEKACLLSHVAAWKRVVRDGRPALVLEDDAVLSNRVPALLSALETCDGVDHLTLEVRKRRKILSRASRAMAPGLDLRRLYQDRSGAAAYVLWPEGARKLLARAERQAGLADAMICKAYELWSYQVEPACAVQLDRCAAYGVAPPIETQSVIDAGKAAANDRRAPGFRLRRVGAQLRMALRALAHAHHAERREVRLDPGDFAGAGS